MTVEFATAIAEAYRAEGAVVDMGLPFEPGTFPVEFLGLGGIGPGVPVRATLSDFGHQLLAKVLEANETQEQSLALVFHYADQKGLPLLDLSDLRALLTFLDSDEGKPELEGIGGLSGQTVGVLLRALVELETALMWLVAELFETLPEAGDLDKPKLVFFFDEAHLKRTVSTFPKSEFYDLEELLPALGIGEASVTILSESGVPTPVVHTRMRAPASRMGPADDVDGAAKASPLSAKYATRAESESAREKLAARTAAAAEPEREPTPPPPPLPKEGAGLADFLKSREGKALQRQVVRGVFGMLRRRL